MMGMNLLGRSKRSYADLSPLAVQPNPRNYRVKRVAKVGDLYVSEIHYPNATNFEGNKILVTALDPENRTELDPHFSVAGDIIARFVPTPQGWNMAVALAALIAKSEGE